MTEENFSTEQKDLTLRRTAHACAFLRAVSECIHVLVTLARGKENTAQKQGNKSECRIMTQRRTLGST